MARPLRIKFEGAWYHVMNRGINHELIFFSSDNRQKFLDRLNKTRTIYGIEIQAYCLMDNHYHLIMRTPRGNISEAMKYLNATYAQYVNITEKRDGPLFKGRYKAILIGADDYLLALSRYIHRNPLSANTTSPLSSYPWSSYRAYLKEEPTPEWLSTDEIINRFGEKQFCFKYKNYVEIDNETKLNSYYEECERLPPVIGEDKFRKLIDEYVKTQSLSSEVVGKYDILLPPRIELIVKVVSDHFCVNSKDIYSVNNRRNNKSRDIAIYICRELGGYSLTEIAKKMGGVSYKAISKTVHKIQSDKKQMKEVALLMGKISD